MTFVPRKHPNIKPASRPPTLSASPCFLVVGAGLAGCFTAHALLERGVEVCLADPHPEQASTRAGAGLMTPLTGKRFSVSWRWPELWLHAVKTYRDLEQRWTLPLISRLDTLHFFADDEERAAWQNRKARGDAAEWVTEISADECAIWPVRHPEREGLRIIGSHRVDLAALLDGFLADFSRRGIIEPTTVYPDSVIERPSHVEWNGRHFDAIIYCDGYRAATNPHITPLFFRNAHGELLEIECAALPQSHVLKQDVFLAPCGGARFKLGATYSWKHAEPLKTEAGRMELCERLAAWMNEPFEVLDHFSGVRPVALQRVPVAGFHPTRPRVALLNGLGSKGALYAPWFAERLVEHMLDDVPLDREVDLARRITRCPCD